MITKIQLQTIFFKQKSNFIWATPPQIPDDENTKNKPRKNQPKS